MSTTAKSHNGTPSRADIRRRNPQPRRNPATCRHRGVVATYKLTSDYSDAVLYKARCCHCNLESDWRYIAEVAEKDLREGRTVQPFLFW